MEISIINGSPRPQGATAKTLREIERYLTQTYPVTVHYYDLSRLHIEFCRGCEHCYQSGVCAIRSDHFEEIADAIKGSDGVIIGSPTHASNVSALLKNFIDRGHFVIEQGLYGKHCFSVVTYEIADGRSVLNFLNKFFRVSGGTVVSSFLLKNGFNQNPLADPKTLVKLHHQIDRYYHAVETGTRKSPFEYLFNDLVVVRMIWKRYFEKHPSQYRGAIRHYQERGIHPYFSHFD